MSSRERRRGLSGCGRFKLIFTTVVLYCLAAPTVLFHILLLIGCATNSPGMNNIYIASLSGTGIRFSYTSLCAPSTNGHTTCGPSVGRKGYELSILNNLTSSTSTLQYALDLQTRISFVIPMISALLFLFAIFSLMAAGGVLRKRDGNTVSKSHISLVNFLFWSSTATTFAAAYTLTCAGSALAVKSKDGIDIEQGKVMLALQWMTWVFTLTAAYMNGSIARARLNGPETRRMTNSRSRSPVPYVRGPRVGNMSRALPSYRGPLPRMASPVSPI